jgi:SAM-dependent methyltransferase
MGHDPTLLKVQYRDGTKLEARIALHAGFSTAGRDFHDWLFDHIALPGDARLLELGCGTGQMWSTVQSRVPAGWQLTLSDFSSLMLAAARAKFANPARSSQRSDLRARGATSLARACYVQCDAQAIPFPANYYDAVVANHMLYHVPDLLRALGEVQRVLKPGGRLYAAANGERHMAELGELAIECGVDPSALWATLRMPSFRLENGTALLSHHFASVERDDFGDSLAVTDVEPLVGYVLSMNAAMGQMNAGREQRLRQLASERIARDGVIRIAKSSGLFIAAK